MKKIILIAFLSSPAFGDQCKNYSDTASDGTSCGLRSEDSRQKPSYEGRSMLQNFWSTDDESSDLFGFHNVKMMSVSYDESGWETAIVLECDQNELSVGLIREVGETSEFRSDLLKMTAELFFKVGNEDVIDAGSFEPIFVEERKISGASFNAINTSWVEPLLKQMSTNEGGLQVGFVYFSDSNESIRFPAAGMAEGASMVLSACGRL